MPYKNPITARATRKAYVERNRDKVRAAGRRTYHANKPLRESKRLKCVYGITLDERNRMLADQGACVRFVAVARLTNYMWITTTQPGRFAACCVKDATWASVTSRIRCRPCGSLSNTWRPRNDRSSFIRGVSGRSVLCAPDCPGAVEEATHDQVHEGEQ